MARVGMRSQQRQLGNGKLQDRRKPRNLCRQQADEQNAEAQFLTEATKRTLVPLTRVLSVSYITALSAARLYSVQRKDER
ncbi:hypothetical protein B7P43_G08096 [Cryptotermes secundus]|uniref:Uncharacterized protein n=1 Tax=Cryptotermes secundus TaxID=105785 RepID=A0A2J7R8C3_9NEOP|nr:hypothetical protein B7P43_G08096 [Cryptotermes secundus]